MNSELLNKLGVDYLLVNCTNKYLVEFSELSENSRYVLTNFSGSTGDALITKDEIYLFVDGRYYIQAENEVKAGITVVRLQLGQNQDDEIRNIIKRNRVLGIVSTKVSQARLETYSNYTVKLLNIDPINDFVEKHETFPSQAFPPKLVNVDDAMLITNLEEVSYITGLRDFSKDCTSKLWAKLFIDKDSQKIFYSDDELANFLAKYDKPIKVDKNSINAYDYALVKHPLCEQSRFKAMKSIKTSEEIEAYKSAFLRTDKAVMAIRNFIENNDNLSEYDISKRLREEFIHYGAKSLSFKSIVAIDKNSALAHYSKSSKDVILKEGSLVLIDCGAYYESGLATDITRVFVKGKPSQLQKNVYTMVLKASLNAFNADFKTGYEYDTLAHSILDNKLEGFSFSHGLGHGIGINVHEAPPNLSQNSIAHTEIVDGMTFTIEPGLYNQDYFGVRLENSCYKMDGKIHSFVKMCYESKLINYDLLNDNEKDWLKGFNIK